jgi:hypothetical protein
MMARRLAVRGKVKAGETMMLTRREVMTMMAALAAAVPALAARSDETLKGEMVCAKCFLNKADAKECQDVLLVKNAKGDTVEYYVTKNKVAEQSGEACTDKVPATVVGSVTQKGDRLWITPTKIEKTAK